MIYVTNLIKRHTLHSLKQPKLTVYAEMELTKGIYGQRSCSEMYVTYMHVNN